jgi:hypothetical protein
LLEALDLWLDERGDASICVGVVGNTRRCTLRAHGREFEQVQEVRTEGGGWWATWCAIVGATTLCERFERAPGADVG